MKKILTSILIMLLMFNFIFYNISLADEPDKPKKDRRSFRRGTAI